MIISLENTPVRQIAIVHALTELSLHQVVS